MAALDPNDPTPGIRPPLDPLREMTADRDSWRRVAERCEREKCEAAARIAALEAEVAEAKRIERQTFQDAAQINVESDKLRARIAALTAETERTTALLVIEKAHYEREYKRAEKAEAALATARADALEEAARVADEWANKDTKAEQYDDEMMLKAEASAGEQIAYAIRSPALTQPASTQPLTDQGETSTAGDVG